MSGSNQNDSDYALEGLPPSVRRYSYQGMEHFSQIFSLESERLRLSMHTALDPTNTTTEQVINIPEYIVFSIDAFTFEHDFLEPDTGPKLLHSTFNPTTNTLIIKMASHGHQMVADALNTAIKDALEPMGLKNAIYPYAGVKLHINGLAKVPDGGWGPRRPPPGSPRRPTVALEVALSESEVKLRGDVDMWLNPAMGNANIAIAVKLSRRRPFITVDKWERDQTTGQPQRSQRIEIRESESGDEVRVTGSPLTIPFDLLFLRNPDTPSEVDLTIGEAALQEMARLAWEVQF